MEANINFTCRISPDLLARVRAEAQRNRRTVGAELMVLIEHSLSARPITKTTDPTRLTGENSGVLNAG